MSQKTPVKKEVKENEVTQDSINDSEELTQNPENISDSDSKESDNKKADTNSKKGSKTLTGLDKKGRMSFRQFLHLHKKLWPAVDLNRGSIGHTQLMRIWNSQAILYPDKCSNFIIWEDPKKPVLMNNDLDIAEALKDIEA